MKIVREALAGTQESSDLMVKIAPAHGELEIVIHSEVIKQFGEHIRQVVNDTLRAMNVHQGLIIIEDKGALDCVIRARLQSALMRAADEQAINWGGAEMSKLRRSMLFLPGANAAMLSTAFIYRPDSIMFDLEDAVALREKDTARMLVFHALSHPMYQDIETVVRINPLSTPFGLLDLEAAVRAGVDVIRLPKTDTPDDIYELEGHLERIEQACGREVGSTRVMAAIESAIGVINAVAIARSSPRLIGIALAAFDYVMDMQTERGDGTELFYARCAVLHAARAAGIDAFDVVWSDVNDEAGFLREVDLIRKMGFNGKSLINPRQIDLLHNAYAPTQEEVDHARRVIEAAEEGERNGLGVVSLNGKMVDAPIINHAQVVLERAAASGVRR